MAAAAAASLLGLSSTQRPPPTPSAAAAIDLLRPLAKTAPAAPAGGQEEGTVDDKLLEEFLAKRPQQPTAPPAAPPAAPPSAPLAAPSLPVPARTVLGKGPPAAPASRAEKDANLVSDLIAASPKAAQDQSGRDAGVLDSFLRKHAPGPEAFVRRKPAPLNSLDTPKADDAKLLQLVGGHPAGPNVRFSPSADRNAGYGGGYAEPEKRLGPIGYGMPVPRRSALPERKSASGRGGRRDPTHPGPRGKVRTNIIEERAKDDLQEENLQLRRAQMEMKTRLQKLQVQIRNAQEEPKDAKSFEQKAMELGEMHRALSAPRVAGKATSPGPGHNQRRGLRSRQHAQRPRSLGGRLRGRMTAMPFQVGVPAGPSPRGPGEGRPTSPTRGVLPALHIQPEVSPSRHGSPSGGRLSPKAESRQSSPRIPFDRPHSPLPPPSFDVKEPLPAHTLSGWSPRAQQGSQSPSAAIAEVEQRLMNQNKQKVEEMRQRNRDLSSRLDELLVEKMSQDHFSVKQQSKYNEKAKAQDAKIKSLETALERQKHKVRLAEGSLQRDKQQLEIDLAVLQTQLHHAQVGASSVQDTSELRLQLAQAHASADEMKRQIRDITKFAFSSSTDQRMISEQRMKELEELLGKKTQESEQLAKERQEVETECEEVRREATDLEQQSRTFLEDNERKAIQMDEWAKAVRRAQAQLSEVLNTLSEEDRKVMVFSLQFLREREEKAAADVAERVNAEKSRAIAASAGPAPPPSPPHRQTVEELTKKVDAIRAEKDELASELRALQDISQRERDITKDLRKMHQMDLEEIGSQMQVTLSEIERFQKLAVDREARVKELQLRLVKRKEQRISRAGVPGLPVGARADVVSEGGFSNLSDIVDMKNALDFYVTSGQIEERALLELPRQGAILSQVPPASSLVTLVLAEFMHYDVGSSETAGGLRPRYDSLLSFGPFEVGDPEVEHFAKGSLRLELQAFSSGGSAAYVLGRASLPLAALLDCCPQDPNPVVAGTLYFASEEDSRVQIAAVRYKARWRRSIIQELESYTIRRGVTPLAVADAEVAGAGRPAAPGLLEAAKGLIVQIFNATCLVPAQQMPAEALQPYASYEVPGHKIHFTATGSGANVSFEDISRMVVRVDRDFCRWVENNGLHIMVFDASAPAVGASEDQIGLIGEVRVPLVQLLSSRTARVQGNYPLHRPGTQPPVGYIEIAIGWQDDPSGVVATGATSVLAADRGVLTEEQFQVLWQRVIRRLHVLKMAPVDWFYKYDADKDGFWSKAEFCAALGSMPLGMSVLEIEYVFHWTDRSRRLLVSLDDLAAAFQQGKKAAPLEQWARDVYRHIAAALKNQGWTAKEVFDMVCPHRRAQKSEFYTLVNTLELGLRPEQLDWLWKLSDTNSDGLLDYHEFAQRLVEVTGISSTAYPVPKPDEDVLDPPSATVSAAAAAAEMSDAWHDICLARLLRASQEVGWKTVDKAIENVPVREDGLVARAELLAFSMRCHAALSDWELDKMFARLDGEMRGALPKRSLRTALMCCDVMEAPAQASIRRAVECLSRIHQELLRYKPATTDAALRSVFLEVAASKQPLHVQREELAAAALRLGVEQVWLDELWFAAPKLRDNSLDIDSFSKQVELSPMPGEGEADSMSDEHAAILMGRLGKALKRVGGAEQAFHMYRTGADGCLSRAEMESAIAEITKDLFSAHERMLVVRRMDADSDGRISLKELENAVASASVSAIAFGSWAEDVCARVSQALQRENRSVDDLFEALAGQKSGRPEIHWQDFRGLFSRLDPTLTDGQLRRLWQLFDKNGDGGVSREEFHRALEPHREVQAPEARVDAVASLPALLSRLARAMGQSKLPLAQALNVYGRGIVGLTLEAWLDACRGLSLPFSRYEATALHAAMARGPGAGAISPEAIAAEVNRTSARGVPQERWAQDFVAQRMHLAQEAHECTVAEAVQAAADGEVIDEEILRNALSRHLAVPDDSWAQLRLLMERRLDDGLVLWRPFLQWVCGFGGGAPMGSVADMVCSRVTAALRKQKKSAAELFDALAGVKAAVYWQDFCAFFSQMERSLTEQQLQELWYSFDKNGDGSVSKEEFTRRIAEVDSATKAVTDAICARVNSALRKEGKTVDELFQALAGVKEAVHWPDFKSLFAQLEPTLREEQLEHLWRCFDTDGDGGISREEFRQALTTVGITPPAPRVTQPAAADPKMALQEVCKRIAEALRKQGQTVDNLFDALASGRSEVRWDDFRTFFAQLEPSLKEPDLLQLWQTFDANADGGISREEFRKELAKVQAVETQVSAECKVSEEICSRVAAMLRREGTTQDQLFDALANGHPDVVWSDFRALFAQLEPNLSEQQLEELWRHFDKNGDGGVSREEFKRALGAVNTAAEDLAQEVCSRVMVALAREGKSVAELFEALSASRSTVQWKDFVDFFQALEPNLTRQQLEMLWRTFDKDGDGSVSREEFQRGLQFGSVQSEEKKAPQICMQLALAIFKQGKTVLQLFDALAAAEGVVKWTDFQSLFLQLEPSLRANDLESLWKDFDKDGDGSITKQEFFQAMEPSVRLVVAKQSEVVARLALALQRQNQSVDQLFTALASEGGVVSWPDFRSLFQQWEPSLGEDDLHGLWRSFDKDGDGSVTREEFVNALAPATKAAVAHTEEICKRVASMLFQNGRTVNQLFDALSAGKEQVAFEDFRSLFQQLEPSLTLADLQSLWRCFDKDGDGTVTRQEFLKAMAPSAKLVVQKVSEVCTQVVQLLQQQGKTVEELFHSLAENQVVRWEAFCAFFQGVSSALSEQDLHGLWHSFDKDGDGTVSKEEFLGALRNSTVLPVAPPDRSGAGMDLTDALWQAMAEVATLRAAGAGPRGSAALRDAIRQQLAAFDLTRTGFLEPNSFGKALRSYSPALPDAVVEVLRGQVCEGDGKVQIDVLVGKILQPPEPSVPRSTPEPPKPPSEVGGPLWSALRRIRPALHERSLRLATVFQRWLPAGSTRLSKETLGMGVAGIVGSELSEAQLQALYGAMSKHVDLGASAEDFVAAFAGASGAGFETFAREVLGRAGRALLRRAKGSLSGAFHTLDITGEGEVRLAGFRAALLQFGDLNLNDEQVTAIWELAKSIGGYKEDAMDFGSFKTIFGVSSPVEQPLPGSAKRDPGPSLEESCIHFHRLQRTEVLRAAIFSHAPDVYLPYASIALALRQAAPELAEAEVAQICRLAPQKGGALHGEDAFSYSHLLERFESDRKDFHPLNPRERSTAADMCRYMDQRLQAQGFASISAALEGEVIRADQLLDHLQLFLPTPMRPEDLKVAENLLRLGRPLSDGGIDVVEFCQRFELLARNGAAAASAPPAPVKPPPIPDTDVSKIMLRERPCPVDLNALGLQRMAEVALRLQREFPDGTAALYRLVRALEAETKALPSARQQDQLKRWLEAAPGDTLRWPMMLGFEVIVEKLTIMATKELRKSYSQFQLGISFCGRDLKSRRVPWRMGLMCLSKPSTMEMQPKWHVIFAIDGPDGLTSRELSLALSETPEPPPSHRLRFILYGIRAGSTGGVQEEVRELGCCELCAGYDLPSSDLRPSDPRAQRIIEVSATEAELAAGALSPALRATLQLSTKRAGRLREVAGIRSEEELHARG